MMVLTTMVLKGSLFSYFSIWSLNPETDKGQVASLGLLGHNLLAQQRVDKWLPKNSELFSNGSEEDQASIPALLRSWHWSTRLFIILYFIMTRSDEVCLCMHSSEPFTKAY